jgi:hypothetical protein
MIFHLHSDPSYQHSLSNRPTGGNKRDENQDQGYAMSRPLDQSAIARSSRQGWPLLQRPPKA